jgi:4-hydroxybenzoate polyprenyltransferase
VTGDGHHGVENPGVTTGFRSTFLELLVISNVFAGLFTVSVCAITLYLTRHPIVIILPLTVFSGTLFIYTMNRFTDRNEDIINNPRRFRFIDRYGKASLSIAAVLYLYSLAVLLGSDVPTFLVAVLPVVIAILYSVFRLKRVFLAKNIAVASAALCSVAIVLVYFRDFTPYSLLLALFFFLGFLINTIIFDIKDIRGDLQYRIATIPAAWGIRTTKIICSILLVLNAIIPPFLARGSPVSLILCLYTVYLGLYIAYADDPGTLPSWYYGIFVDGECLFLGACFAFFIMVSPIIF